MKRIDTVTDEGGAIEMSTDAAVPWCPPVYYEGGGVRLHHGDALALLRSLPTGSMDAAVTDPPYSSGGLMRSDRAVKTSAKYVLTGTALKRDEFYGDNRDQRSWGYWSTLWLSECLRVVRPGGALLTFVDWRQLPTLSDAIQAGGWIWRGIIPWNKTAAARPQKGWFRGQCEYVLTATHGSMAPEQDREGPCLEGFWTGAAGNGEKIHMTGKPVDLMRFLLSVVPSGGRVVDPFAGGGTTLVAAKQLSLEAVGSELSETLCAKVAERLQGCLV